jgi:acyl carrier protein
VSIRTEVVELVSQNFGRGKPWTFSDEDSLLEQGLLDSLALNELVNLLSQRFSVDISEEDVTPENLDTIAGLTRFLESKGVSA